MNWIFLAIQIVFLVAVLRMMRNDRISGQLADRHIDINRENKQLRDQLAKEVASRVLKCLECEGTMWNKLSGKLLQCKACNSTVEVSKTEKAECIDCDGDGWVTTKHISGDITRRICKTCGY